MKVMVADRSHDAALRHLLRETPLRGALEVTLEREPTFFESEVRHEDVVVAMDDGRAIACGARVVRRVWWQGVPAEAAYLTNLRVHPDYQRRSGRLLRDGYRKLGEMAGQRPAVPTWSAIFSGNDNALTALARRRRVVPEYVDRGALRCPLLWCGGPFRKGERLRQVDRAALAAFLTENLQEWSLAPVVSEEDIVADDFAVIYQGDEIVAAMAVHDLRAVKQVRISRLPWSLRLARRCIPGVPAPGGILAMGHGGWIAVKDNDVALLRELLISARQLAATKGLQFLCLCFHEGDPRFRACRGMPAVRMDGRLFQVMLGPAPVPWSNRIPQIESSWL